MINTISANTQFPFYVEGLAKSFQREGNFHNTNLTTRFSYNNKLPKFQTPFFATDTNIATSKIYKLDANYQRATTYAEFKTMRISETALSITINKKIKGEYYYFQHDGNEAITALADGFYEIVLTTESGLVFESEVMKVCGGDIIVVQNYLGDDLGNIFTDHLGNLLTYE